MKKFTKFAAGLAVVLCLTGAAAGPALAGAGGDPTPQGVCEQPRIWCVV